MTSSAERMALADRLELAEMVETRIGQNFDGECHLDEAEARLIARRLRETVAGEIAGLAIYVPVQWMLPATGLLTKLRRYGRSIRSGMWRPTGRSAPPRIEATRSSSWMHSIGQRTSQHDRSP